MPKPNDNERPTATPASTKSAHDDYELPDELDYARLEFVGVGLDALRRHAASKAAAKPRRTVGLEPDVAAAFPTEQAVNSALRAVIRMGELVSR